MLFRTKKKQDNDLNKLDRRLVTCGERLRVYISPSKGDAKIEPVANVRMILLLKIGISLLDFGEALSLEEIQR